MHTLNRIFPEDGDGDTYDSLCRKTLGAMFDYMTIMVYFPITCMSLCIYLNLHVGMHGNVCVCGYVFVGVGILIQVCIHSCGGQRSM